MKKIILDCDPGMDDSIAIAMAAKSPTLSLLAVTVRLAVVMSAVVLPLADAST